MDGVLACHIGEASACFAYEDGGGADIVALYARVDHRVDASQKELAIAVKIRVASRCEGAIGEALEDAEIAPFGKLLESAMGDGGVLKALYFGDPKRATIAESAMAARGSIKIIVGGKIREPKDGDAIFFEADEDGPAREPSEKSARSIDGIDVKDKPRRLISAHALFFAEDGGVLCALAEEGPDERLDLLIGGRDGATIGLELSRKTSLGDAARFSPGEEDGVDEIGQKARAKIFVEIEAFGHERSIAGRTKNEGRRRPRLKLDGDKIGGMGHRAEEAL